MEEAGNAVKNSTKNSLVIVDELGRGTSTFDGVALAYSILKYLALNVQCRTIFATHYHVLIEEFKHYHRIGFYHMACHISTDIEDTVDDEKVIFLYKLKEGNCSNSFGINAAKVN
jgi:DNA mismatch repair protein MSH6